MLEVYPIGKPGITRGIDYLITLIKENKEEIVSVGKIDDGNDNYSYMALFREKGTIGQLVAFVHEWGVYDGGNGEGGRGFIRMNEFLEDNKIETMSFTLSKKELKELANENDKEKLYACWKKHAYMLLQKI